MTFAFILGGFLLITIGMSMWQSWKIHDALRLASDALCETLRLKLEAKENRNITAEVLKAARASAAYEPPVEGDPADLAPTDDTVCTVCEHKLGFHAALCHYPCCPCQVSVDREPKEIS